MRTAAIIILGVLLGAALHDYYELRDAVRVAMSEDATDTDIERAERLLNITCYN